MVSALCWVLCGGQRGLVGLPCPRALSVGPRGPESQLRQAESQGGGQSFGREWRVKAPGQEEGDALELQGQGRYGEEGTWPCGGAVPGPSKACGGRTVGRRRTWIAISQAVRSGGFGSGQACDPGGVLKGSALRTEVARIWEWAGLI